MNRFHPSSFLLPQSACKHIIRLSGLIFKLVRVFCRCTCSCGKASEWLLILKSTKISGPALPCPHCPTQNFSGIARKHRLTLVALATRSWEWNPSADSITLTSWFLIWPCQSHGASCCRVSSNFVFIPFYQTHTHGVIVHKYTCGN